MATLGELERATMDVLWDARGPLSAGDLRDALASTGATSKELAVTTVLTVLSRLENKGFVTRDRESRPHVYRASTSRAEHMAELMHEVLGSAPDRDAVLARFVGQVSASEAEQLRKLLATD
jgi:BlaI family transcriptional regulator, penicillinase repressor